MNFLANNVNNAVFGRNTENSFRLPSNGYGNACLNEIYHAHHCDAQRQMKRESEKGGR